MMSNKLHFSILMLILLFVSHTEAEAMQEGPEPVFFEDFNAEELPEGWSLINFGDEGREWVFLEPVEPVRQDGQIGTGYTIFEPFEGGIALAEAVGTLSGPNVHIGLQTPAIDLSDLDEVILRFDQNLRSAGTSFGLIEVSTDGETWQEAGTVENAGESVNNAGLFQPFEYDIFPETSEYNITEFAAGEAEVYVRFTFNDNNGSAFWWMIDNVELFEPLPRPNPAVAVFPDDGQTDLRLTVGLEWMQGSGVTPEGYLLSFGTDVPPTNIEDMLDVGTQTTYQPEGELEYSTTYYWQVFPYDGEGVIEDEIEVWSFTTKDDPVVTEFPYSEDFSDTQTPALPIAWRFEDSNENGISWETSSFLPFSGENAARVNFDSDNPKDDWLFSPAFEFETGNTYEVTFWYTRGEFIAPRVEKMKLHLADGTSSAEVAEEPIFDDNNIVSETYIQGGTTFTVEQDGRLHLAWHAYSDANQRVLWLDDIQVRIVPPEPDLVFEPESLTFDDTFVGGTQTLSLFFENEGAEDLEISASIENDTDFGLSSENITVAYNTVEELQLTFSPQQAGDLSTTITLNTNDPENPVVEIPVSATALEAPEAGIEPDAITLEVTEGSSEQAEIVISNSGGNPLTYSLSTRPAGSERPAPDYDLIRELSTMPSVDRGMPSFIANEDAGSAGNGNASLLSEGVVIQDSLFYDAPGLQPDEVVGIPDPDIPFWGATRFTAGDEGFYLTHVRNWMRSEAGSASVLIQVYRGGDNPTDGELLSEQTFSISEAAGESSLIELDQPALFSQGEDFWVVFRFAVSIVSPQGINNEMSGENADRFRYWFANQQEWIELPNEAWAYKTRAVSAGLEWIELDSVAGTVEPGEEQTATFSVNGGLLDIGSYEAVINVSTNDPVLPSFPVTLSVEVVEALGDAFVQVVHNAADPLFGEVDVYVNGELAIPEFSFRSATPYLTLPAAETEISVTAVGAPLEEAVFTETYELAEGERYQIFANGVADPDQFPGNPEGLDTGFTLFVFPESRDEAEVENEVEVAVFHGVTDAPAVELSQNSLVLIEEASYGDRSSYLSLQPDSYELLLSDAVTGDPIVPFLADLSMLEGQALTVMASGFVNTISEGEDRTLGLFAVLSNGDVAELEIITSGEPTPDTPVEYALDQNYPNPFNPVTNISYALPESGEVTLEVFNLQGQRVAVLVNGHQQAGRHTVSFNAERLASGVYLYRIQSGDYMDVRKMMLVK